MEDEKQLQLAELIDELDIILSVKNRISKEEIDNFKDKFNLLTEYDIRTKIAEITEDNEYIENFHEHKVIQDVGTIKFDSSELNKLIENTEEHISDEEEAKNSCETETENQKKSNNEEFIYIDKANDYTEHINIQEEEKCFYEEKIKEYSFNEDNIPEVLFIKAEIKYGQLSVEWGWPEEIHEVLICCRMDKFPMGPNDLSAQQIEIKRQSNFSTGNYVVNKAIEGNYYFSVYCKVNLKEKLCYSEGVRRLVVNKTPSEIFYKIKNKRTIFGKIKSSEIVISTDEKELNLPQFTLVGKRGNMPLQKSDGENIVTIDYHNITREEDIIIELPYENIGKNMYVKLFFLDDTNSKIYRIISPAKEKLYFK